MRGDEEGLASSSRSVERPSADHQPPSLIIGGQPDVFVAEGIREAKMAERAIGRSGGEEGRGEGSEGGDGVSGMGGACGGCSVQSPHERRHACCQWLVEQSRCAAYRLLIGAGRFRRRRRPRWHERRRW